MLATSAKMTVYQNVTLRLGPLDVSWRQDWSSHLHSDHIQTVPNVLTRHQLGIKNRYKAKLKSISCYNLSAQNYEQTEQMITGNSDAAARRNRRNASPAVFMFWHPKLDLYSETFCQPFPEASCQPFPVAPKRAILLRVTLQDVTSLSSQSVSASINEISLIYNYIKGQRTFRRD